MSLSQYPFIHKLDKLSISVQTREAFILIDNERIPILTYGREKKYKKYLIDEELFRILWKIVEIDKNSAPAILKEA